jgi:glycosyltransferase involved in cell wall biosynthesis
MKKILLIVSDFGKGGAERSISLLSYYLEHSCDVTLCILSGTEREKYYKTCSTVVFIDPPADKSPLGKIKAWRFRLKKLREIKRNNNIDVAISFLEGPDYANVLTRVNEKVVLSIRGSKVFDKQISGVSGWVRKNVLIPVLYKKADKLVCVTDALGREMAEHFHIPNRKIDTIYNFYEAEDIISKAAESLTPAEEKLFTKPVIINSGRLHMQKEQDKLLKTFALLKLTIDARLLILGDGELKPQLIALAHSLGLSTCDWTQEQGEGKDVYFMGFQANAFKYYNHSRLFALSSSWEGFPNVMAEALICNLPVIATDCYTGPREMLNIGGLDEEPVRLPVRTSVGSLMPLLQTGEADVLELWSKEMTYWLSSPQASPESFSALTDRFQLSSMLEKWKKLINN